MNTWFQHKLEKLHREGNLRSLIKSPAASIDFASNDYLGFARSSSLVKETIQHWQRFFPSSLGSSGSRLLTGNSSLAEDLEKRIADFHEAEDGLLFNSGYTANLGLLSAIASDGDVYLYDSHIHDSTRAGMQLSSAKCFPWRHNDCEHLSQRLQNQKTAAKIFVIIESVYSCDGSIAPMKEIFKICQQYHAQLIVDEAHATGVLGRAGKGLICEFNDHYSVLARIHTFSKALGVFGAIVLGSSELKRYLINHCRPLIYTTALPTPLLLMVEAAYRKLECSKRLIQKLHGLIQYFKENIQHTDLPFLTSYTPIQSLIIPGAMNVRTVANALSQQSYDVRPLTSPTVQKGKERLRICLHAFNTYQEIDQLISLLCKEEIWKKSSLPESARM